MPRPPSRISRPARPIEGGIGVLVKLAEDGTPSVRFVVKQAVQPGDELLFSYGDAYWDFEEPVDDESWDDPRLYHDKDK